MTIPDGHGREIEYSERTRAMQEDAMRHVLISLSHYEDVERSGVKIIERGEGCYVFDADGRRYLDTFASLLTSVCGHHRPEVHQAMLEQMRRIEFYPVYHDCITPVVIELSKRLAALAPGDLEVSYLVSDGSDATESAIKMARQYFYETGQPGRYKILYRRNSYHGASMGAMAATGLQWFREVQPPVAPGFVQVMAPNPYRCELGLDPEQSARMALCNTEAIINWEGPQSIAAMILDPVPGSNTGFPMPPAGYIEGVRALCDRHGILLIFDEVQVGFGRTGKWFCCENWGVVPDILAVAKGFSGGYLPLGAAIARKPIADAFHEAGQGFRHVHTYSGHATACAATLANIEIIETEGLVQRSAELGAYLSAKLEGFYKYPFVGDVRGVGTLWAVELVADRETREPLSPAGQAGGFISKRCRERGMILRNNGDILVMAPALVMTDAQADEMIDLLDKAIADAFNECDALARPTGAT